MKRIAITPRSNYKDKLEEISFKYHSLQDVYWDESAYYEFNPKEIDKIEAATATLYDMCLGAVQHVIDNKLYDRLFINPNMHNLIEDSWNNETPSFYGRFDLGYDPGKEEIKLFEFNADTPTSLYEAAVVQWFWLEDFNKRTFVTLDDLSENHKPKDQFNSIHEKLLGYFQGARTYFGQDKVYFACVTDSIEDYTTVEYIRDLAHQAGLLTEQIYMNQIGWNGLDFTDMQENRIPYIFKLYPWEWLSNEEFGDHLEVAKTIWMEAPWKAILSNKGILPILWDLNPGHPLLLKSTTNYLDAAARYVKKPIYSREGANVEINHYGTVMAETDGEYGEEGYIYQEYMQPVNYDGNFPVIGSWVVDQQPAGMGIREDTSMITGNLSRFIPHLIS